MPTHDIFDALVVCFCTVCVFKHVACV